MIRLARFLPAFFCLLPAALLAQDLTAPDKLPGSVAEENPLQQPDVAIQKLSQAIESYSATIESQTDDEIRTVVEGRLADAHLLRGMLLQTVKRDFDGAIGDFTNTIRYARGNAKAHYHRGQVYLLQGKVDAARSDFDETIRLEPQNKKAFLNRGLCAAQMRDFAAADEDFSAAIRLDPSYAKAYYNRGELWVCQGEHARALPDLNEAIRLDPAYSDAYVALAVTYTNSSDPALQNSHKGIQLATKACELTKWQQSNAIATLAAAHSAAGEWNDAIRRQEQAVDAAPEGEKALLLDWLEFYKRRKVGP